MNEILWLNFHLIFHSFTCTRLVWRFAPIFYFKIKWCSIYQHFLFDKTTKTKELSLYHKLRFSSPLIFSTLYRRPYIFQTINSVRSNYLSLKYQRYTPSVCKEVGIRKFEFVAKTQILQSLYTKRLCSNSINIIFWR